MAKTRIYFVSDLHGSSVCFRKFVNAAKIYEAKVMILGGDVAGKAIQSIVRAPQGHWQCRFIGTDYDVVEGPELTALEKLIADHGYYAYRADPGELEAKDAAGGLDDLFLQLMRERLTEWLELADARLRPLGIPLYFMLGNDDPEELGALLDSAPWGTHDEGKVVWLDDEHEMISCGYSNIDAVAHLPRAGRDPPSGLDRCDGAHAGTSRESGLQPARAALWHAAGRSPAPRREPHRAVIPRSGADGGGRQHRGARRRADVPAIARPARSHP